MQLFNPTEFSTYNRDAHTDFCDVRDCFVSLSFVGSPLDPSHGSQLAEQLGNFGC
jgi:hypothetical protein